MGNDRTEEYRAGMAAYNTGRYAEAIACLGPLADALDGPRTLLARFYLGQAHYRLAIELSQRRRFGEATPHFEQAARLNPLGGGLERFLASCEVTTQPADSLARDLVSLLQQGPDLPEIRIRLALAQWKQGNPRQAQATLREGIRRDGDHAELHYQLGVMLAAMDRLADARASFEKAIGLDPKHTRAHERLAQCHGVGGLHDRALHHLQIAHLLAPEDARIALQLSILAQSPLFAGQTPDLAWKAPPSCPQMDRAAVDRLGEVIVAEPDFVEAFLSLPVSEVDQEVFTALATTLESALSRHPAYADLHYHCGAVYRRLGRSGQAIEHAERAVQINPRYVNALILLAQLYAQTQRLNDGIARLEEAVRRGGDCPDVHYLIGRLCQREGQTERARHAFSRALALNQNYPAAREALNTLQAASA